MAVKGRPSEDDDGGLDSLLDTMTNVVGILVLVLIVTQMSVVDVVNKITTESTVDEESLKELQQKLEAIQAEEDELERILVDPLDIDAEKQREELQKKKELLERRKKLLEEKKKEQNDYALKLETDQKLADKNKQEVEETEAKRKELQTLISSSLEKKAQLESMLDKTPRTAAPADIEVSIPNPRPAPEGAREFLVLCADNRLYPVNTDVIRNIAGQRAKEIIAKMGLPPDTKSNIDPKVFTNAWEKIKEQDDFFAIEYFVADERHLRIRLTPREGRGATAAEVGKRRGRIWTKYLNNVDPNKYYARFFVLPDSFEVYATARRMFTQRGILAGWDPQGETYELTTWVPGGIELGPEREKPPPDPNRKPANVID